MEVAGLRDKASNANGVYALAEDEREGHRVWRQEEEASHNGHELSHDGEAWTVSLADHQTKCWAFVESEEPEPHRIPAAEWQVYDGEHWVDAPADFAVREAAEPSPAAQRPPLPSGWEVCTSRSTKRQYYLNTHVRAASASPPRLAAAFAHLPAARRRGRASGNFRTRLRRRTAASRRLLRRRRRRRAEGARWCGSTRRVRWRRRCPRCGSSSRRSGGDESRPRRHSRRSSGRRSNS